MPWVVVGGTACEIWWPGLWFWVLWIRIVVGIVGEKKNGFVVGIEFVYEEGIKKMLLRGLWVWKGIRKMESDRMGVVTYGWCCLVLRGLLPCE